MSRPAARVSDLPLRVWELRSGREDGALRWRRLGLDRVDHRDPKLLRSLRMLVADPPGGLRLWTRLGLAPEPPADPIQGFQDLPELPRCLGLQPFVCWHRGRWYQNLVWPHALAGSWLRRVRAAWLEACRREEDQEAGLELLGELQEGGRHARAGQARAALQQALDETRRQRKELDGLRYRLAALEQDLEAERRRRRRPPERAETHCTLLLDLEPLYARVLEYTG